MDYFGAILFVSYLAFTLDDVCGYMIHVNKWTSWDEARSSCVYKYTGKMASFEDSNVNINKLRTCLPVNTDVWTADFTQIFSDWVEIKGCYDLEVQSWQTQWNMTDPSLFQCLKKCPSSKTVAIKGRLCVCGNPGTRHFIDDPTELQNCNTKCDMSAYCGGTNGFNVYWTYDGDDDIPYNNLCGTVRCDRWNEIYEAKNCHEHYPYVCGDTYLTTYNDTLDWPSAMEECKLRHDTYLSDTGYSLCTSNSESNTHRWIGVFRPGIISKDMETSPCAGEGRQSLPMLGTYGGRVLYSSNTYYDTGRRFILLHPKDRDDQPLGRDCYYTETGTDYIGYVNMTSDGTPCSQWLHATSYQHLENNFCRNPESSGEDRPWCFVCDENLCHKESCPIEKCDVPSQVYTIRKEQDGSIVKTPVEYTDNTALTFICETEEYEEFEPEDIVCLEATSKDTSSITSTTESAVDKSTTDLQNMSAFQQDEGKSGNLGLVLGVSVSGLAIVLSLTGLLIYFRRYKAKKNRKPVAEENNTSDTVSWRRHHDDTNTGPARINQGYDVIESKDLSNGYSAINMATDGAVDDREASNGKVNDYLYLDIKTIGSHPYVEGRQNSSSKDKTETGIYAEPIESDYDHLQDTSQKTKPNSHKNGDIKARKQDDHYDRTNNVTSSAGNTCGDLNENVYSRTADDTYFILEPSSNNPPENDSFSTKSTSYAVDDVYTQPIEGEYDHLRSNNDRHTVTSQTGECMYDADKCAHLNQTENEYDHLQRSNRKCDIDMAADDEYSHVRDAREDRESNMYDHTETFGKRVNIESD